MTLRTCALACPVLVTEVAAPRLETRPASTPQLATGVAAPRIRVSPAPPVVLRSRPESNILATLEPDRG